MNLQFKFLAVAIVLAIIAMWLEGCTFAVVEDAPIQITWAQAALAEEGDFIGRGSRDAAGETRVKEIQSRLQSLGYLNEAPDGIFGKNTEGALTRFQAENGLAETGVVDYATGYRLVSPMAKAMPEPDPVDLKKGDFRLIRLGVAMKLPAGYEAHVVPRSSTYKNFGIIQANHHGVIDNAYSGDNDEWMVPVIAMRDTQIHINDRICQFRIERRQPDIFFEEVDHLDDTDRGGFGSTGIR